MRLCSNKLIVFCETWVIAGLAMLWTQQTSAQWSYAVDTTPAAQRSALNAVRSQVNWFQNATRTAPNYGDQGYGNVLGQFQGLRDAYNAMKGTLNSQQQAYGANAFAELDAGLDIIAQAFTNYQNDVGAGRNARSAFRDMCQVLREGSQFWAQQLNRDCARLGVGR